MLIRNKHLRSPCAAFFIARNNKSIGIRQAHYLIRIRPQCSFYCFPPLVGLPEQYRSHFILTCLKHITRLRHFPITQHTEHSAGGGYAHA